MIEAWFSLAYRCSFTIRDITPMMENQMEKNMENEMEATVCRAICRVQSSRFGGDQMDFCGCSSQIQQGDARKVKPCRHGASEITASSGPRQACTGKENGNYYLI